jgi:hypothetical protein
MSDTDDYLSGFFRKAEDHLEFLRLMKSLNEEKALQLLTELIDGANINLESLSFSEDLAKPIGQNLIAIDGFGIGTQRLFQNGTFQESNKKTPLVKVMDTTGRFAFSGEVLDGKNHFNLIIAETAPEFRRKGLFQELYKAICWFAFQKLSVASVCGRAAEPRFSLFNATESNCDDWFMRQKDLLNQKRKPSFQVTNLLHLWLTQLHCYPKIAFDEYASSDEFFIAKPELLKVLGRSDLKKLEESYPKDRFYSPFKTPFKSVLNY